MDILFVNLAGIVLIGLIIWYFWLSSSSGTSAGVTAEGVQETKIIVEGGYSPDTIHVRSGRPVRLIFDRREADPCSERVVFDALGLSADLPTGTDVPVEFTPAEPGEYEFACQMGMLRGKVIAS